MALLFSLLPAGITEVRAAGTTVSYAVEGGNIYFDASRGKITRCDRAVTVANIPSAIEGVPVTTIGDRAFLWCDRLTSVTIPDSVTTIGESAFSYCSGLTSLTIPDSVTTIGESAFSYCSGLTSLTIPDSVTTIGGRAFSFCSALTGIWVAPGNTTYSCDDCGVLFNIGKTELIQYPGGRQGSYTIPNGVTTIGDWAFYGCTGLTSVTIPGSVTTIGDWAFSYCSDLTSVTIGDSVTTIGYEAFCYCTGLTSVTIPDSVTTIGDGAFSYCSDLTSVTIGDRVTTIGRNAFCYCTGLTSVTIGDSVTTIGDYAFYYCYSLTSVIIPDSVTTIGYEAFVGCTGLTGIWVDPGNATYSADDCGVLFNKGKTELIQYPGGRQGSYTIPNGVTTIGYEAFYECTDLTSVTIPDSVTTIGEHAFCYCTGLTSVTIGDSVTTIGYYAFYRCDRLTSVTIPGSVTTIGDWAFSNCTGLTSVTIPDSVTTIGNDAFSYCSALTSVTVPDSVTTIGDWAFSFCSALTSVTIPNSVTTIGGGAFYRCDRLTSVTIPDSVTTIGDYTFSYCSALTSVTIPGSVTTIGNGAFYACSGLTDVYYCGSEEQWNKIEIVEDGNEFLLAATMHYNCGQAEGEEPVEEEIAYPAEGGNIYFDPSTGTIIDCDDTVTSAVIPGTINGIPVTTIGDEAFYRCKSLTSVTIGDSVTTIGDFAFSSCYALKSITIGDGVTTIGNSAFAYCSGLTSITIPDGVTTIGDSAFSGLYDLTSITIPDSVTTIGYGAFTHCDTLTSITIPDSVTSIGDFAFNECKSLTGIWVQEGNEAYCSDTNGILFNKDKTQLLQCPIRYSGAYAIPDSVTTIGNSAFYYCSALTDIIIPDSVTTIGDSAFYQCDALTSVTIPDSVTTFGDHVFFNCNTLTSITIGDGVTAIGNSAFYACPVLTSITIGDSVTTIGDWAFYYCEALTSITLPDSITTIGYGVFSGCSNLTGITIPDGVTAIDGSVFYECRSLTSITIPDSVTTIGYSAFSHCDGLTDVYYAGTEAQWNNISIDRENEALLNATIHYNVRPGSTDSPEDPTDPEPVVDGNIKIRHTLNLASDIAINFVVGAASLVEYDSYYMECVTPVYEGNTLVGSTTHILEPELRGSYYYFVLDGLTSLYMNDTVEARLCMNKAGKPYISETDHYSIATYAYNQLSGKTPPQALKTVCVNLLQYGAKAQLYKGYRTDTLPDVDLTPEQRAYLTDPMSVEFGSNKAFLGDHAEPTVTFAGVSLRLDSKIVVRYIIDTTAYKGNMGDLNLRVSYEGIDGNIVTETVKDPEVYQEARNYYAFDFDGLLASELRTVVSAVVYAGDTPVSETMTYSADTYGNGRTGDLLTLVQAMIAYSDSCKAYFA